MSSSTLNCSLLSIQQREMDDNISATAMTKGLKNKPPALPESSVSQGRQKLQMMTQST